MKLEELTEVEYRAYWEQHPLKTFLSAPEIGHLRQKSNWHVIYLGLKENDQILAATMLLGHKRHFNCYEFYSPRGFLIDFSNQDLVNTFVTEIKKYLKKRKAYVLRIDPYLIKQERDIDGNIVEKGQDNTSVIRQLKSLGFKQVPTAEMEQVGWMFSLNLENKTEEEILKEMKSNTRNIIRKAEKFGIVTRELNYEELDKFQSIMEETGARKGFSVRKVDYYQEMYRLFHDQGQVKYYITELNLTNYIEGLTAEKKEKEEKRSNLNDAKYNEGIKKNLDNEIASLEKRISESTEIINKTKQQIITLSGSMFMLIKPEIIYLSSGNYEEYMKFNSQYLIQWLMIRYGIENGFKKHNFYGIPAEINTHPKDYGIYEFKRGFNGCVEELIGEYELPLSPQYHLFKIIHRIKGDKK